MQIVGANINYVYLNLTWLPFSYFLILFVILLSILYFYYDIDAPLFLFCV